MMKQLAAASPISLYRHTFSLYSPSLYFNHVVIQLKVFRQTDYMISCLFNSGRAAAIPMPPQYVTSGHEYVTLQAYFNHSYYAMLLPPIPKDCPTPMGISGEHFNLRVSGCTKQNSLDILKGL